MKILTGRVLQNGLMAVFLLTLLLGAIRLWPHPPLWQGLPQSSVYYDRHGALLRITLANDDRYRLWTPLEQVSPLAVRGLLLHEDRWFYYNPGFNPVSLMRGFWRSYVAGGKMQGGSTISMQLARMRWHLNTRTPGGKLLQVLRAVQLENQLFQARYPGSLSELRSLRPQHRKHRRRQPDLFRQVAEGFDPAGGADAGGVAAVAQLPSGAENRRARRRIDSGAQSSVPALAAGLPDRRQPANAVPPAIGAAPA